MVLIENYPVAIVLCFVTMLCWGSWANTQKLTKQDWPFPLFYWDYCLGVLLLTVVFAFTLGSTGEYGRGFLEDLSQAEAEFIGSAFVGGCVFNVANILLVAAIDIAGMAIAFPIGIGLALVIGVVTTYLVDPTGDPVVLFAGVAFVTAAIVLDALAYRQIPSAGQKTTTKGIALSVVCGVLMGQFFPFVAGAMPPLDQIDAAENAGMLTPYTALVFFALGLFLSSFVVNTAVMLRPFAGEPVPLRDYFVKGTPWKHAVGVLGGVVWAVGMSLAVVAGDAAGYAISYGLGQGATMVAAFWGVFVWREFESAPNGGWRLLAPMFGCFLLGLGLIIYANAA